MAVMGDLADLDVSSLLQMFGVRRASGRLRIAAAGDEVTLYLQEGRLVLASSARLPLRLGRVFQRRGVLTTVQLHTALRQQETEGRVRSLGDVLIARGWVTPAQLAASVEEQGITALTRVLAVEQGTFAYEAGGPLPRGVGPARLDVERLLLEAARRVDEMDGLRRRLPTAHAPLALSGRIDVSVVPLNAREEHVVVALRAGAGSLAELLDLLPVEELAILGTVLDLMRRGLVIGGHGAPGADIGVPPTPPPTDDDVTRLFLTPADDEISSLFPVSSELELDCLFPIPTDDELDRECAAAVAVS